MPNRQIALIRGINVGRAKRIAMADLRALVEGLGYTDVRTLLNSGNVVFTVPKTVRGKAAPRVEAAIEETLGVSAKVMVLTASELSAAIDANPLLKIADNPSRLLVAILDKTEDGTRIEPLMQQDWLPEALAVGPRVVYVWCAQGILESRLIVAVGRALGDAMTTTRNWATMLKLKALVEAQ